VSYGLLAFTAGEIALRAASRFGILLFDVEMWKYAREVKRASADPEIVLEHRPDVEAPLMGVRVRTDARGFRRASPDVEAARTGRERVVAIVGDSCAFGWGVPEDATLSSHLERLLNASLPTAARVVVINAGVGNSNTAMEHARYVRDVRRLRPVWVIVAYFINDAEENPPARWPLLVERSVFYALLSTRLPVMLSPTHGDYRSYYASLYEPSSPGFAQLRAALRAFGGTLRADGVPGTLLLVPEMHAPRDFASFAPIYRQVGGLALESGFLEVVDPSPAFAPGSGEAYWVTPGYSHPDGEAQGLLAQALAHSKGAHLLGVESPSDRRSDDAP
jgi:hypothetical protein